MAGSIKPVTLVSYSATMAGVDVEVVVAHSERVTLRVGEVFLKVDSDQKNIDVEVEAMALAPVPTPEILWRKPPVLAIAALPGTGARRSGRTVDRVTGGLGCCGRRSTEAA